MKPVRDEPTPHERRIAAMTYRERLIFRLIRRIAHLMGKSREFDAECDRIASLSEAQLQEENRRTLEALQKSALEKAKQA